MADAPRTPPAARRYDVLRAVRVDDAYTNLVLPRRAARARAVRPGRGVHHRAGSRHDPPAGHVRRHPGRLRRPPARQGRAKVLDALRLGAHQLLAMRVPAHAAISTTVDLVRARVGPGPAGFANAVLRKVSERRPRRLGAPGRAGRRAATRSASRASCTATRAGWSSALREAVGDDELDALLAADNAPPRVTLVARPGGSTRRRAAAASRPPTRRTAWCSAGGDPGAIPAVADGRAGVQDEGSQLVALALAWAAVDGRDDRWLDLCAGPGGKAALLAALAAAQGAGLVAAERQPHRAGLVARALAGAGGVLGVVTADGTRPAWSEGAFDRVLVDAPCTGLGALRRRPEARWRRSPADLDALVPLQRALLSAAAGRRAPGRGGGLRDLLAGPRRDLRRRRVRCSRTGPTSASRTPGPCSTTSPTAPGRWPAPSSCGRTATAPTRCSWPCCAVPDRDSTPARLPPGRPGQSAEDGSPTPDRRTDGPEHDAGPRGAAEVRPCLRLGPELGVQGRSGRCAWRGLHRSGHGRHRRRGASHRPGHRRALVQRPGAGGLGRGGPRGVPGRRQQAPRRVVRHARARGLRLPDARLPGGATRVREPVRGAERAAVRTRPRPAGRGADAPAGHRPPAGDGTDHGRLRAPTGVRRPAPSPWL